MARYPFEFIPLAPERSTDKPRESGLTMMIDWGLGLRRVEDTLDLASQYVDLGKIAVGTPRLYEEGRLRAKFEIYADYDVRTFLGGMFIEHHYAARGMDAMPAFYDEARRVGFRVVEVSDNLRPFSANERRSLVQMAIDAGLEVFGEVGAKWEDTAPETLVSQAAECFEAGCELVLVEGAELVDGEGTPRRPLIDAVASDLDLARIMFELPGPWIGGVRTCDAHDLKKLLIREFGPDVNIGNVMPDDVLETETMRAGLSVIGLGGEH